MKKYFLLIIISNFLITDFVYSDQLKSLFIALRHGDRTILPNFLPSDCPSDPYLNDRDKYFPDGLFQLSILGKQKVHQTGKIFRKRYSDFLGDSIREVEVKSMGQKRMLTTAQIFIDGMYTGRRRDPYHTVPIHTRTLEDDEMFGIFYVDNCPKDKKIMDEINSKSANEVTRKYDNLMKYLTEACGRDEEIKELYTVALIYDLLISEQASNLTLHDWATESIMAEMKEAWEYMFYQRAASREVLRLRTGVFFNDILEKMKRVITDDKKPILNEDQIRPKKVYFYSTFDFMLLFLLVNLKIDNGGIPVPSSSIVFEFYENSKNDSSDWEENSSIKIMYYNETMTDKFYELKVPSCQNTDLCTIKKFKESLVGSILDVNQWKEACSVKKEKSVASKPDHILIYAINAVAFISMLVAPHFSGNKKCERNKERIISKKKMILYRLIFIVILISIIFVINYLIFRFL